MKQELGALKPIDLKASIIYCRTARLAFQPLDARRSDVPILGRAWAVKEEGVISHRVLRLESGVLKPTAATALLSGLAGLLLGAPGVALLGVLVWFLAWRAGKLLDPGAGLARYAFRLRDGRGSFFAADSEVGRDESFLLARVVMRMGAVVTVALGLLFWGYRDSIGESALLGVSAGLLFSLVSIIVTLGPDYFNARRKRGGR